MGCLRTAISETVQYEQFLGTIEGSGDLKIGLSMASPNIRIQAAIDGTPTEVLRDSDDRCVIRLGEKGVHRVDLQLWVPNSGGDLNGRVAPVMQLPIGIEWLYWQLILPQDQHLVWATPTMGRAMRWELDRWRLNRVPLQGDDRLVYLGSVPTDVLMPLGNRYLFVGVDAGSLTAIVLSRQTMWTIVGVCAACRQLVDLCSCDPSSVDGSGSGDRVSGLDVAVAGCCGDLRATGAGGDVDRVRDDWRTSLAAQSSRGSCLSIDTRVERCPNNSPGGNRSGGVRWALSCGISAFGSSGLGRGEFIMSRHFTGRQAVVCRSRDWQKTGCAGTRCVDFPRSLSGFARVHAGFRAVGHCFDCHGDIRRLRAAGWAVKHLGR